MTGFDSSQMAIHLGIGCCHVASLIPLIDPTWRHWLKFGDEGVRTQRKLRMGACEKRNGLISGLFWKNIALFMSFQSSRAFLN